MKTKTNHHTRLLRLASLLVLAVLPLLYGCKGDDKGEKQAWQLLEESRQAMQRADFAKAHILLDSLRQTYPHATEVRWAALAYEDTLCLEEAKVEVLLADSIYDNACLDREELRSTGIDTLSAPFKLVRDRADSLRYATDRAHKKVQFYERKIQNASAQN